MIKFSIVVPAYKVEKYLSKCIESITSQTYRNLEIILVNDGSPDGCLAIMLQYAERDDRVIVVSQENGGLSAARNAGLKIATGDYVAFIDSDDWIEPIMFAELNDHIIGQQLPDFTCFRLQYDLIASAKSMVYGEPYAMEKLEGTESILKDTLQLRNIPTPAWSKVYNRKFLLDHNLTFKPGIVNEDTLFSVQVACHADKVTLVNRVFYHTVERPGSISRSAQDRLFRDMAIALDTAKEYMVSQGLFSDPGLVTAYYSRYVRSMLYNILQAAQRLPFGNFQVVHAICMNETEYKKYGSRRLELPSAHRILHQLSLYPTLFYLVFKIMYLFGFRMH